MKLKHRFLLFLLFGTTSISAGAVTFTAGYWLTAWNIPPTWGVIVGFVSAFVLFAGSIMSLFVWRAGRWLVALSLLGIYCYYVPLLFDNLREFGLGMLLSWGVLHLMLLLASTVALIVVFRRRDAGTALDKGKDDMGKCIENLGG